MTNAAADYPLNCIDNLSDGFSGWFAISNTRQCNDFCYWHQEPIKNKTEEKDGADGNDNDAGSADEGEDEEADSGDDGDDGESQYTAWNTANPHQTTVIHADDSGDQKVSAYWVCVYDAADDTVLASQAQGQSWIESWHTYYSGGKNDMSIIPPLDGIQERFDNVPFPYLRCQKGAGEKLKTTAGEVVKSATFWESWIVISSFLFLGEIGAIILYSQRRKWKRKYERVGLGPLVNETMNNDDDAVDDGGLNSSQSMATMEEMNLEPPTLGNVITSQAKDGNDDENDACLETSVSSLNIESLQQMQINAGKQHYVTPRCKYYAPLATILCNKNKSTRWWSFFMIRLVLVIALNLLLVFTISFSAISLMEINSSPSFKESMESLTPQCSDPNLVCPAANEDIERESTPWNSIKSTLERVEGIETTTKEMKSALTNATGSATQVEINPTPDRSKDVTMPPFSYLIASDAQLYWFNGEFAEMGLKNIPSSCSPTDSCGKCTGKHGYNVNTRLKKAWESLMIGETDGMDLRRFGREDRNLSLAVEDGEKGSGGDLPVPDTLIMNGDLTAYFHPYEKHAYDSIYKDVGGLKHYFPSLGNHDIEHMSGAMYGGDQWAGPPNCNIEHAIGYFKSAFCGQIPNFHTDRILRYDASSLAYSWDEGRYHFVHSHYYPTYEMASMKYRSSVEWLEKDLQLARDAGLATVLFVHAVEYLNPAMERIILEKNVVAIFAGHTHRCLHRKCEGIYPLHEDQVANVDLLDIPISKCIPAAYDTCQVLNGENLIYVKDMSEEVSFPKKKLHNTPRTDQPLCPKPTPFYINETDNSLLCRRVLYSEPNFPFNGKYDGTKESIPIFWSGSSSFETFLKADFFQDRIVINAMTILEDGGVARYIDAHDVPNSRYPHHNMSDLDEVVIRL